MMDEVIRAFLTTDSSTPPERGPLWKMPKSSLTDKIEWVREWPVRNRFPVDPAMSSDLKYMTACAVRDARDTRWYWEVLVRQGLEGFGNMLQVEPPLSFLFLRCKLTRQHIAVDAASRKSEARFCVNCYKPMPHQPLGFWDRVTRVYRY